MTADCSPTHGRSWILAPAHLKDELTVLPRSEQL
jgi:hypothetical protein